MMVIGKQKSNVLAVIKLDLDSRPFAWCVRLLFIHRQIIMSHNSVTAIKKMLTHRQIGTQIAFHRDMMSKIQICFCVPSLTQEPSQGLHLNLISIS